MKDVLSSHFCNKTRIFLIFDASYFQRKVKWLWDQFLRIRIDKQYSIEFIRYKHIFNFTQASLTAFEVVNAQRTYSCINCLDMN